MSSSSCDHSWHYDKGGRVGCTKCGYESTPAHLDAATNAWASIHQPEEFKKFDSDKPELNRLFEFPILDSTVEAMSYGAEKYGDGNWKLGTSEEDVKRYFAACLRHIRAYYNGEETDSESGIHHLGHAITNLLFISELKEKK